MLALNVSSDVLDGFDEIKACTAYEIDGKVTDRFPYSIDDPERVKPIYTTLPGWKTDLTTATKASDLPKTCMDYVAFIEAQLGVPVVIVSVGPDRSQTIGLG